MNTLIDPLKRIARDLVDKKLWPVAVLLLAALVAVPVMLGGSSAEERRRRHAIAATAPAAPGREVTRDGGRTAGHRRGHSPAAASRPFYDPPEPPDAGHRVGAGEHAAAAGEPPGAATLGRPAADRRRPRPRRSPPSPSPHRPTTAPSCAGGRPSPSDPYPIRRLTPFGGLANTAVQYLGVTKSNGNYAVFVLGVNATSDGEATCEDAGCRVFGLKSGQTQLVTVQPPDGGEARQYNLYVAVGQVPHGGRGHCTDDAHQGPCRRG